MKAIYNDCDYASNVEPHCRTTPDGWDCEVFSAKLLRFTDAQAKDAYDREHVTTYMRDNKKGWKHLIVVNHIDLSMHKLSVDTEEEYARISKEYEVVQDKLEIARALVGESNVHRL
jgi:spore coat polysaccharide biosynthesis protein SpsF (cytidylyltransferase family)